MHMYIYGGFPFVLVKGIDHGPTPFVHALPSDAPQAQGPGPGARARGPGPGAQGLGPGAQRRGPGPGAQGPGPLARDMSLDFVTILRFLIF